MFSWTMHSLFQARTLWSVVTIHTVKCGDHKKDSFNFSLGGGEGYLITKSILQTKMCLAGVSLAGAFPKLFAETNLI
jgi:hypothetical protein